MLELTPINQNRYLGDSKGLVVEFLRHYLQADHGDRFAHCKGVDVYSEHPNLPEGEELQRPLVIVAVAGDELARTLMNSHETQHWGEHHELRFSITCHTDSATGGAITCDDLQSAVNKCLADHGVDLETAGLTPLSRSGGAGEFSPEAGLYSVEVVFTADVDVMGKALRTIELELGRWTFTAIGRGVYADGHTLTTPHRLRIKCLTGTGIRQTQVTVYGVNQAGQSTTLVGVIPPTRSAGTYIALTPAQVGDTFTNVTQIAVSETSGLAGESFAVVNIPVELS